MLAILPRPQCVSNVFQGCSNNSWGVLFIINIYHTQTRTHLHVCVLCVACVRACVRASIPDCFLLTKYIDEFNFIFHTSWTIWGIKFQITHGYRHTFDSTPQELYALSMVCRSFVPLDYSCFSPSVFINCIDIDNRLVERTINQCLNHWLRGLVIINRIHCIECEVITHPAIT